VRFEGGILWEQLESVGVPGIVGTYVHNPFLVVVAIRQQYAGHAKQAGMAVLGSAASSRNGRFVVIVDEDIDPSNMKEVIWAMTTRVDPKTDIEIVDGCWATPLDPRMPPEQTASGPFTNSRAIVYAVRPWSWKDKFPPVNRIDQDQREAILKKFGDMFAFPRG
jgi:4-hydroxy-3-polyprenylbenzoate decarboxylase